MTLVIQCSPQREPPLFTQIQQKMPRPGYGLGTRILLYRTFTDFFYRAGNAYWFFAGSCIAAIVSAAFVRDIPHMISAAEKLATGALSIADTSCRTALYSHIAKFYLWPIGVNLMRVFFLSVIGTIFITGFLTLWHHRSRIHIYSTNYHAALHHCKNIQRIYNTIQAVIPNQDPQTYLENELNFFKKNFTKSELYNIIISTTSCNISPVPSDQEPTANQWQRLQQACIKQINQEGYKWLEPLITNIPDPLQSYTRSKINESRSAQASAAECCKELFERFRTPIPILSTEALLSHIERENPIPLQVHTLYQNLQESLAGYKQATQQMRSVYTFNIPIIGLSWTDHRQ